MKTPHSPRALRLRRGRLRTPVVRAALFVFLLAGALLAAIVFTLNPNDAAICRVPSPEPSNWKMCISRLDNSSREVPDLTA